MEGKSMLLRNLHLRQSTTLNQMANFYGVLFEEPCGRCDCQTIVVAFEDVLVAKETKDGPRTKLGEAEVG
jgi:hypothetical protein